MSKLKRISVILTSLAVVLCFLPMNYVSAASLTSGSVTLSDSRPSQAATTYTIKFSGVTTSAIKCIHVQFSTTSTTVSKPSNLTVTSAAFDATSNYVPTPGSWTTTPNNTNGTVDITFTTGETPASASNRTVVLTTITNGDTPDVGYFLQFSTYNNTDCVTSPVDSAVIMFIYTTGQTVTATVDPTLTFTVNGVASGQSVNGSTTTVTTTSTTVPLGTLSTGANSIAAQDLTIGTNASNGYTITAQYTGGLSNGVHAITDFTGTNAAPAPFSAAGTEAFGYTTNDAVLGTGTAARFTGGNWAKFTTSPLEVAFNAAAASETTRIGFQAGIAATTQSGAYTTTVIYIATPTY